MKLAGRFEFTIHEIATVVGVKKRAAEMRAAREAWPYTETTVQGGRQRLYPMDRLPEAVQLEIVVAQRREHEREAAAKAAADTKLQARIKAQWEEAWRHAKGWRKKEAEARHDALLEVERVRREEGVSLTEARKRVAAQAREAGIKGREVRTLIRVAKLVERIPRPHWLAFLLPEAKEGRPPAEIHPLAWAAFKKDWLRLEEPDAAACYRRVARLAKAHPDWLPLPCIKTFTRLVARELPASVRVYMREGDEALAQLGPKITRDRSDLAALAIVNADGHTFDVAVRFPDGTIGRPVMVGWQDVYSGKLLSYRIGRSETADLVRLAFCDMVEKYGIPQRAHLDNGRAFASKTNTGGIPTRYRYKVKPEDPQGVLTRLGVDVRWVTPYNGKAKPIERAWRDFATDVAKRSEFAGAYTGNSPTTKPENYGSHAVPLDEFLRVVADGVAEYNARTGRRSEVADGRSFDETFAESYARTVVTKASREQLAMLLLASEVVMVNRRDGNMTLAGNRYWDEKVCDFALGQRVELRFDPAALHAGVHVFSLDGAYIGSAECTAALGWNTTEGMQRARKLQAEWKKRSRALAKVEEARSAHVPSELPLIPEPELPAAAAVALYQPPRKPAPVEADAQEDEGTAERAVFWIDMAKKRNAL
ncbi:MAG: hypothetical protein GXC76_01855 [Rhodanobacteraceae bacterium]|jgi:hypothetical protein|nr:hypothetical protein [Rhodanobacteraceae bacterium]